MDRPIEYSDRNNRVWQVSEVARLNVVTASIDGPSHFLVIRFEREGEERFARWIGGDDWRVRSALDRLFAEANVAGAEVPKATPASDTETHRAPETLATWLALVATMGPDELADFEERSVRQFDAAAVRELRGAIRRRRQVLGGA